VSSSPLAEGLTRNSIGHEAEENETCANKTISDLLQLVMESSVQLKVAGPEDSEDSVVLDSDKQQYVNLFCNPSSLLMVFRPLTAEEEHTQASNSVKYFPAIVNGAEQHLVHALSLGYGGVIRLI